MVLVPKMITSSISVLPWVFCVLFAECKLYIGATHFSLSLYSISKFIYQQKDSIGRNQTAIRFIFPLAFMNSKNIYRKFKKYEMQNARILFTRNTHRKYKFQMHLLWFSLFCQFTVLQCHIAFSIFH